LAADHPKETAVSKPLTNAEDFCIKVANEEVQSDRGFQCSDCGRMNDGEKPTDAGTCVYYRSCIGCDKTYYVQSWSREGSAKQTAARYPELFVPGTTRLR
jgi:hypothetical protein